MIGSPWPGFGSCEVGLWFGITLAGGKHNPSASVQQVPRSCGHSRCAGMDCVNHWIPAFAGMTGGAAVKHSSGMAMGLSGWQQTYFDPRRHSSAGWNPGREAGEVKG